MIADYETLLVRLLVSEYGRTLEDAQRLVAEYPAPVATGKKFGGQSLGGVAMVIDDADQKKQRQAFDMAKQQLEKSE